MTMDGAEDRALQAWRAQPTGEADMNANAIRLKAERLETRTTRQMNLARVAFALVVMGNIAEIVLEPNELERIGSGLTILAVVFLAFDYRRRAQRAAAALPSGAVDSLRFYRAELLRQRDAIGQFWWRWVLPFVPGLALSIFGSALVTPRSPTQYAVLGLVFAVLLGGIALVNRREARKLDAEIDELDR